MLLMITAPVRASTNLFFLAELTSVAASISGPWVVVGDFNLLRSSSEQSNGNLDAREANMFNSWIEDVGLVEIPLLDRRFTWTNNQPIPILAKIDRALVNTQWNFVLPDSDLRS